MGRRPRSANFEVPRAALMAWPFAFSEPTRPNLNKVHFESSTEGVGKDSTRLLHSVATDGNRLLHVWWEAQKEDILDIPFEVSSDAIGEFFDQVEDTKGGNRFTKGSDRRYRIGVAGEQYILSIQNDETAMEIGPIVPDWTSYPIWRDCMPKRATNGPVEHVFSLNLQLIEDLQRYLKEFNEGCSQVRLSYNSTKKEGPVSFIPLWRDTSPGHLEVEYTLLDNISAEFVLMTLKE
jgi:hypothetical protein